MSWTETWTGNFNWLLLLRVPLPHSWRSIVITDLITYQVVIVIWGLVNKLSAQSCHVQLLRKWVLSDEVNNVRQDGELSDEFNADNAQLVSCQSCFRQVTTEVIIELSSLGFVIVIICCLICSSGSALHPHLPQLQSSSAGHQHTDVHPGHLLPYQVLRF